MQSSTPQFPFRGQTISQSVQNCTLAETLTPIRYRVFSMACTGAETPGNKVRHVPLLDDQATIVLKLERAQNCGRNGPQEWHKSHKGIVDSCFASKSIRVQFIIAVFDRNHWVWKPHMVELAIPCLASNQACSFSTRWSTSGAGKSRRKQV